MHTPLVLLLPLLVALPAASPDQGHPAMGASRTGWSAVAYEDHADAEVHLRQYNGGTLVRDVKVSAGGSSGFSHVQPSVGVADNGDAVVVWAEDSEGDGVRDIDVRVVRADGTMSAITTANGPSEWRGDQTRPKVSVRSTGAFVVTWEDHPDAATTTVRAAGYSSITSRTFGPVQVNAGNGATNPAVSVDNAGSVVVWEQNTDVYYAKLSSAGTVTRASAPANGDRTLTHQSPAVSSMPGGDFAVAWSGNSAGPWQVKVRGFRADLSQRFAQTTISSGGAPSIGMDDTGGFAMAWTQGADAYAAGYNSDATSQRRFPRTLLGKGAVAIGVSPADATFGAAYEDGAGSVVTRLGMKNLTAPDTVVTDPLVTVPGTPLTMTYSNADLAKVQQAEQTYPQLAPQPVSAVLASANSTAKPLCHPTYARFAAQGFCWDDRYGDDSSMTYVPQGVASNGGSLLLTSWYNTASHPDFPAEQLTRLTFTDSGTLAYRHALLVRPTGTSSVFAPVAGHADAIVLSGNYLFLRTFEPAATGTNGYEGFDVFDLRHIWKMTGSGGGVGMSGGVSNASYHLWALPRVATYHFPTQGCGTYQPDKPVPCITAASLDVDAGELVTFEAGQSEGPAQFTTDPKSKGDIVRWPVNPATGLLAASNNVVTASARLTTKIPGLQGGASHNGRYVLAGPCPEWVGGMYNIPSCLYTTSTTEPATLWTRAAVNLENLAYVPSANRLWMLNEAPGQRVVYSHSWPQ